MDGFESRWKNPAIGGVERVIETGLEPQLMTTPEQSGRTVAEFEALLRSHDSSVRPVAYRIVGGDVDDVLQQAYMKAFRRWSGFRGESSFGTWLHRIVYTTSLDHLRAARRRQLLHLRLASDHRSDATPARVEHLDLERALAKLPVDQRVALLLVDGQGFGYDDAATVLKVAPGTIASRLNRARAAMRTELSKGDLR